MTENTDSESFVLFKNGKLLFGTRKCLEEYHKESDPPIRQLDSDYAQLVKSILNKNTIDAQELQTHLFQSTQPINISGGIVSSLQSKLVVPGNICRLLEENFVNCGKLGQGVCGSVFEMKYPHFENKKYVIKKFINTNIVRYKTETDISVQDMLDRIKQETIFSIPLLNKRNLTDILRSGEYIEVIVYLKECQTGVKLIKNDGSDEQINKDDNIYMCSSEITEYILGTLAGQLYRSGKCINFIDTNMMAACPNGLYIVMDKIDASLYNIVRDLNEQEINSIFLQTLYAIYLFKRIFKLNHNDLHLNNIFLYYTMNDTEWNGKKIVENDYISYSIGLEKILYIPVSDMKYIAKLGDWGLGSKYSNPIIIKDNIDEYDDVLPTFYSEAFDVILMINNFVTFSPTNFIINIAKWCNRLPNSANYAMVQQRIKDNEIEPAGLRPQIDLLETDYSHVTAKNILLNRNLMQGYSDKPTGKILNIGTD